MGWERGDGRVREWREGGKEREREGSRGAVQVGERRDTDERSEEDRRNTSKPGWMVHKYIKGMASLKT